MAFGIFALLAFLLAVFSAASYTASLYGLETDQILSTVGIVIWLLFVFKGIVALGLWTEKTWAVDLAITDAIIGIAVCAMTMLMPVVNSNATFTFRLELALLIPFLVKLLKIRAKWKLADATA